MATKKKFKRDYIILEAKDTNFRYKERVLPKAFAKVEINDEKSIISLYVENLKFIKDGYRVVVIQSDYDTLDLGKVVLSEQGKGEFTLDLKRDDIEIKGVALLHEKNVPLIGFKGSKIDNYEEILFAGEEYIDRYEEYEEYEEVEYIEVEDDEDGEYEEIEYVEVEEDEGQDDEDEDYYEIMEEEDDDEIENDEENSGYYEIIEEQQDTNPKKQEENKKYEEYDNVDKTIEKNRQRYEPKKVVNEYTNSQKQQNSKKRRSEAPNVEEEKTAGTLLMPRQIKRGLRHFKEVKPFVDEGIENTRWWKIEITPATLCGYSMPYLGYVNTLNYTMYSDAVMQSYKYRHYLFGVQYDEYNKRKNYIYAVPGNKSEQPDKGHTGFRSYQPCDTRNDSLGYWLCMIDSRSRKISK